MGEFALLHRLLQARMAVFQLFLPRNNLVETQRRAGGFTIQYTDKHDSSGMCKAGFAGDDAPRAVFRKLNLSSS